MWEIAFILALMMANAFFAASEIALVAARSSRLRELASDGHQAATIALDLRANPERLLATVQVGITVVGATAAVFGGATLEPPLAAMFRALGLGDAAEELAMAVVVAFITTLSVVLGELVPKSLALRNAASFALLVARPIVFIAWVARPVVWLLTALSNLLLRPFGDRTQFTEARLSPDELHQMLGDAAVAGTLDPVAADVAQRAMDAATRPVSALMVPRRAMLCIDKAELGEVVLQRIRAAPHARYPVVDGESEVVGYALAREIYEAALSGTLEVGRLIRVAPFIPERTLMLAALRMLQRARTELGLVVDEFGVVVGLVTIEDIVEDLLGEVLAEEEKTVERIRREGATHFLVDGSVPVHELSRTIGAELPEDPAWTTIAGLVVAKAGRIPKPGDRLLLGEQVEAEVVEATLRRVTRVRIRLTEGGGEERESPRTRDL
jgi:putative hemolysin